MESYFKLMLICLVSLTGFTLVECELLTSTQDVSIVLNDVTTIKLYFTPDQMIQSNGTITAVVGETHQLCIVNPSVINYGPNTSRSWDVTVKGDKLGRIVVSFNVSDPKISAENAFVWVTVLKSKALEVTSVVIGWIYFVAWSVSFYPQLYTNWRRKSVIGLNFDFLALNLLGFVLYSMFNCGLYWIPVVEQEYLDRHPKGLNPVQINDIFFSVHASIITVITILQCYLYERGSQRVSGLARVIIAVFFIIIIVSAILASIKTIHWLDFLTYCSYIKLTITLIKYIPQAFMNFRRKSTIGWSIGNVLLDFTGGILSMLQMVINADNYDDWVSIFGDATKFGLGLFSVLFDLFFLLQHYVLYRDSRYAEVDGGVRDDDPHEDEDCTDDSVIFAPPEPQSGHVVPG